jgi:hypothetical protein
MKKSLKNQMAIILCVGMFIFSGCWATVATVASNPVFQTTVQYGVMKYLGKNPDKVSPAERIVDSLIKYTSQETELTIKDLEDLVVESIPWEKLEPADQLLLTNLLITVRDQVRERIGDGLLDAEDKVQVLQFLSWIKQAIYFAQK